MKKWLDGDIYTSCLHADNSLQEIEVDYDLELEDGSCKSIVISATVCIKCGEIMPEYF